MDYFKRLLIVLVMVGLTAAQINFSTSWGKRQMALARQRFDDDRYAAGGATDTAAAAAAAAVSDKDVQRSFDCISFVQQILAVILFNWFLIDKLPAD